MIRYGCQVIFYFITKKILFKILKSTKDIGAKLFTKEAVRETYKERERVRGKKNNIEHNYQCDKKANKES